MLGGDHEPGLRYGAGRRADGGRAQTPASAGSASGSAGATFAGSRSVPAMSSSRAWRSVFGRKPDFMPKYTACGWWATIAIVDCSGSTA